MRDKRLVFYATCLAILFLMFILLPTKTIVSVKNTLGEPQGATLHLYLGEIPVYSTMSSYVPLYLPKFWYRVVLEREGFHTLNATLSPTLREHSVTYTLSEIQYQAPWTFFDPTGTIKLDPFIKLEGRDARGKYVSTGVGSRDNITYGEYVALVRDVDFEDHFFINGTKLEKLGVQVNETRLAPNEHFVPIDQRDYTYIRNFIEEYLNLSTQHYITEELEGYPRQYHLTGKNITLSFGDMTLLLCEAYAYKIPQEHYFVPLKKKYAIAKNSWNVEDCYRHALRGYTPQIIDQETLSLLLGANKAYYPYEEMINQKQNKGDIAFTFDIESGRYVQDVNKGPHAINPCESENTALGIEENDRKACLNPNRIAWFSPQRGTPSGNVPYPWSSGVAGLRSIIDLSKIYGIKTTNFLLTKEFTVYDQYDPTLLRDLKVLARDNLTEIALHSKYHSRLDDADPEHTLNELKAGRLLLEEYFDTDVAGYRAPYLSILQRDQNLHESTLRKAGLAYYSHGLEIPKGKNHVPITLYYLADNNIWNVRYSGENFGYVVTIDHPWNFNYEEREINSEWYLVYNETRTKDVKATIFEAISDGYVPVFTKELA